MKPAKKKQKTKYRRDTRMRGRNKVSVKERYQKRKLFRVAHESCHDVISVDVMQTLTLNIHTHSILV